MDYSLNIFHEWQKSRKLQDCSTSNTLAKISILGMFLIILQIFLDIFL